MIAKETKNVFYLSSIYYSESIYFQMEQFHYFPFFDPFSIEVKSLRKEFAHLGAKPFVEEWAPFEELDPPEANMMPPFVIPIEIMEISRSK